MAATAVQGKTGQPKYITWKEFQSRYLRREDKYKYEWLNGIVEKTERSMETSQFYILSNLLNCFRTLFYINKVNGELITV